MGEYITISEVSKRFQISTRMLRHYEKLGLIESVRRENYAYRVYDTEAVRRVRQIIVLRKLQVPLKKIQAIMEGTREDAVHILEECLRDMDESVETVQTMRRALARVLELLRETYGSPAEHVHEVMDPFIRDSGLYLKKPDSRYFGFNHPDPEEGSKVYGYEVWVTIPEDMEVPGPLMKKHFPGGLYAAYAINFPDFFEWQFLYQWAEKNEQYEPNMALREEKNMGGSLEEHLNWVYSTHMGWPENGIDGKLDLLLPIRRRETAKEKEV